MQSVSIVGCGYTGLRLARRWLARGRPVVGYGTRAESLAHIAATGAAALEWNLDDANSNGGGLEGDASLVYYCVPPAPVGPRDERLERCLGRVRGTPQRMVYLSTTGVYGNRGGALVDEEAVPAPQSDRAVRRLAAENALRCWADSVSVSWCILRLPGIYGPGRLPLDRLRRGDPAIDPAQAAPGNRIHVDDLVTACIAAGSQASAHRRVYNITDGSADSATAFLQRVARIHGLTPPPLLSRAEAEKSFSPMAWSFLTESRRVDNARMRQELGVQIAYADLDVGIRASS